MQFYNKWREFLAEAPKDAKILRNINIDHLKKEIPKDPDEEIRDYFARLQSIEADPEQFNPVFPNELVSWMEELPDNCFPTSGRKRFAKWLGNAIYFEETDGTHAPSMTNAFRDLYAYENDVRFVVDYLNGATDFPKDLWEFNFYHMHALAIDWHNRLAAGIIGKDELPSGKLNYVGKKVVYKFDNGYSIVEVDPTAGERDYTKAEGLRCGWAHDEKELQEFHAYYDRKGVSDEDRPNFSIRDKINDLDIEGCAMGHCVGGYCDTVTAGKLTIYSLRSPGNSPHATIDVSTSSNKVEQIKGNQNAPPIEKYRPMIKQWLQQSGFEYDKSTDYLNILSPEEIFMMMRDGKLPLNQQVSLARDTENQEILDFLLDKIEDKLEDDPEPFGRDAKRLIITALAKNDSLNEETRIRLLKVNLPRKVLGAQVGRVLGTGFVRFPEQVELARLNSSAWAATRAEVMSAPLHDEKLYYMKAFVEGIETDQSIKEEILEHILREEFLDSIVTNKGLMTSASMPYGQIIQEYLRSKSPDEEMVSKIYRLQENNKFILLLGGVGRLTRTIANSRGMSDGLVDNIIKDIEAGKFWSLMTNDLIDMVRNKKVSESDKIRLLDVAKPDYESIRFWTQLGSKGIRWSPAGKSHSRNLKQAADEGFFTSEFVKYLVDEGFLDPIFSDRLRGKKVKATGKDPLFDRARGEEREAILRDIRQMAEEWSNSPREKPPWTKDELMEGVRSKRKHKTMTADDIINNPSNFSLEYVLECFENDFFKDFIHNESLKEYLLNNRGNFPLQIETNQVFIRLKEKNLQKLKEFFILIEDSKDVGKKIKGSIKEDINDYFSKNIDKDYLKFNDHPQSSLEKLLDEGEPAPWE